MPIMLIVPVAAMGLVLVVLAFVVAGIRQEPSAQELIRQPPRLMAKLARRLLGVHVRRPDQSDRAHH
jgi:K+-sensing histidine kinase KdpD